MEGAVPVPTPIGAATDWRELDVGRFNTCAVAEAGGLRCTGRGVEGQLGNGSNQRSQVFVEVALDPLVERVAVGPFHVCAQRAQETSCWGDNGTGKLGTGDPARKNLPAQIDR